MTPKLKVLLAVTVAFLVADQASKALVVANITPYRDEVVLIPDFLSIVHAKNKGAAFSSFAGFDHAMKIFAVFTVVALGGLWVGFRQLRDDERFAAGAIGLILSGALGNAIDRVRFREVTDWVKVFAGWEPAKSWFVERFGTYIWPIWNVADAAILVGVVLFALRYLFEKDTGGETLGRAPDPV